MSWVVQVNNFKAFFLHRQQTSNSIIFFSIYMYISITVRLWLWSLCVFVQGEGGRCKLWLSWLPLVLLIPAKTGLWMERQTCAIPLSYQLCLPTRIIQSTNPTIYTYPGAYSPPPIPIFLKIPINVDEKEGNGWKRWKTGKKREKWKTEKKMVENVIYFNIFGMFISLGRL